MAVLTFVRFKNHPKFGNNGRVVYLSNKIYEQLRAGCLAKAFTDVREVQLIKPRFQTEM